jgi:hypothetical protein
MANFRAGHAVLSVKQSMMRKGERFYDAAVL